MKDFMEVVKTRRSMRKFEDKPVPDDMLNTLLEAVRWSPSWANTQAWEVVVVKDQAVKDSLQETMAPKNPATKAIAAAPVVLAFCAKLKAAGYYNGAVSTKLGDWFMFDLGIASQSLWLTAQAMGLGAVIVGLFDQDRAGAVLGVPEGYQLVTLVPLGFPAKDPPAPKRREIGDFTHYDKF